EALAAALLRVLRDPGLGARLGDAARRRVAERFTPEAQIAALTEIVGRGFPPAAPDPRTEDAPAPRVRPA
ncbi:MAG TPA: hypothetical protein VFR81_23380, partial [Longimicrobium sp.]|nr:hypothetical protein [Longimicrobium sp.]